MQLCSLYAQNFEVAHLLEATKNGDLETIKQHTDMFQGVEQERGCTFLHEAVFFGHMPVVQFLVEHDKEALNKITTAKDGGY